MNYLRKNKISLIVIFFFCLCLFFYAKFSFEKNIEIEKTGIQLVSKLISTKKYVKTRDYYFLFFFNNEEKIIYNSNLPKGFQKNIGKFYRIKYLPQYPNQIIIDFENEVTDKEEILKAGFKD